MRHGGRPEVKKRSCKLRKAMSPTEIRLWNVLRRNRDFHFRKQHSCGPFTLDFFCASRGLVVEVDGESHNRGDRPGRDVARDAWLREEGFLTLRIAAIEVLRNLEGVLTHILDIAAGRPLHHRPVAGGPLPRRAGEVIDGARMIIPRALRERGTAPDGRGEGGLRQTTAPPLPPHPPPAAPPQASSPCRAADTSPRPPAAARA